MKMALKHSACAALTAAALASAFAPLSAVAQGPDPVPEAEEAKVLTLDPPKTEWGYIHAGWNAQGTSIFDGKTGKMRGMVETSKSSDMAIDPAGKFYYVSETIWSKGDRGTRQDMVSVYDSTELKLRTEIPIPGRIIVGGSKNNFIVSDDGTTAFVYDLDPASSVNVVDLAKRKFVRNIELPGCASLIPNPGVGFSALCADGSMATVATGGKKASVTRTAPFFSANGDPIFENFVYDRASRQVTMISYTGLIYQAKIGVTPTISEPWSIQQAGGMRPGATSPLDINWLPGGFQPMALNRKTGHLYVLMHMGEYWSQKAPGTEIWDVDLAAKKVVKRFTLEDPAIMIEVTQGTAPILFVNSREGGTTQVIDATTWEKKHTIKDTGGGIITTFDPS